MRLAKNLRFIFAFVVCVLIFNAVPAEKTRASETGDGGFKTLLAEMVFKYVNDPEAQTRQDNADFPRKKLRLQASENSAFYGLKVSALAASGSAMAGYKVVRQDATSTKGVMELTFANSTDTRIAFEKLKNDKDIISVIPVGYASAGDAIYNTYPFLSWGVREIGADKFVNMLLSNEVEDKVNVAVLSSGISLEHSLIKGHVIIPEKYENNIEGLNDETGKGTHLAGVILDTAGDYVNIMPYKVLSGRSNTGTSVEDICLNIKTAADDGADVICLGFSDTTEEHQADYAEAVGYASSKGAVVISAAGDSQAGINNYFEGAIVVSVTDVNGNFAAKGNYGPAVDFSAPGMNVYGSLAGYSFGLNSGTSVAAAHTSAAAALLKAVDKTLSADEVKNILAESCYTPEAWQSDKYGLGIVNIASLLK